MKKHAKLSLFALVYIQISFCYHQANGRHSHFVKSGWHLEKAFQNHNFKQIAPSEMISWPVTLESPKDGPGSAKKNAAKSTCDSLQMALQNLNTLIFWYENNYIPALQANIDRAPNSRDAKLQRPDLAKAKNIVDSLKGTAKPKIQWLINTQCGPGSKANPGTSKSSAAKNKCDSLQSELRSLNTLVSWYVQDYIPAVQANIDRNPKGRDADLQRPELAKAKQIVDSLKNKAIPALQQMINKQCGQAISGNPGSSKSNTAKSKCDSLQTELRNLNTLINWYVQDYIPNVEANIKRDPKSGGQPE
jgi:hypothetical protein